ncbi:hypothetical protein ACIPH4_19205 [Streptomyces tendae]|uniref:hypothetical protein n=1 Tax=Streptomyces tendae TaxID=1932 RepID=UPI0036B97490
MTRRLAQMMPFFQTLRAGRFSAARTVLGHEDLLGLDATTVTPELTMAPHAPALASLLPLHEASMTAAKDHARALATSFAARAA